MAQASQFWMDVHEEQRVLSALIAKHEWMPKDFAFITSLKKRGGDPQCAEGKVSQADLKISCQRVVEGTHRYSTKEEADSFLAGLAEAKKQIDSEAARGRGQIVFASPKPAEA